MLQAQDQTEHISIHALREEGDFSLSPPSVPHFDFYPRPPRGGRPIVQQQGGWGKLFLSTPSARRATRYRSAAIPG